MKNKGKFSKHFLADKIPLILAAVLMIAVSMLPGMILSMIIEPFYNEANAKTLVLLWCISQIVVTVLIMILFEKWFVPEYEGSMKMKGFSYGMKLTIPVFIFWSVWMTIKVITKQSVCYPPDFEAIVKGMRPGICEEIAFRGIAVALLLRRYRKPENIWVPVIFTSVFFGITHFFNITEPDEILPIAVTSLFATVYGIVLGIIYTFSGCIWPTVILHSLYDIALNCIENAESSVEWLVFVDVGGMTLIMVLYLIYFLKKRKQSAALWNTKWHN